MCLYVYVCVRASACEREREWERERERICLSVYARSLSVCVRTCVRVCMCEVERGWGRRIYLRRSCVCKCVGQVQILVEVACVSFHVNSHEKGTKPCLLPYPSIWENTRKEWVLALIIAAGLEERKLWNPFQFGCVTFHSE